MCVCGYCFTCIPVKMLVSFQVLCTGTSTHSVHHTTHTDTPGLASLPPHMHYFIYQILQRDTFFPPASVVVSSSLPFSTSLYTHADTLQVCNLNIHRQGLRCLLHVCIPPLHQYAHRHTEYIVTRPGSSHHYMLSPPSSK